MYLNTYSQVVSGANAAASFTTNIACLNYGYAGFQVVWSNHNGGSAIISLSGTIDGTNFNTYQSSTVSITSGSSSQIFSLGPITTRTIQLSYDQGSNNAGTIDVWVCRKGHIS